MVFNEQEKYQICFLIEKLGRVFPDKLDRMRIESLKKSIFQENDFLSLSNELESLIEEPNKLDEFLRKYSDTISIEEKEEMNGLSYGYNIEELKRITEGMSEEEISAYLKLHGKNPSQIMMALLMLKEAEKNVDTVIPKQMVLKNKPSKKAAFVNSLYLVFLVGMISGALFFFMLQIILHSL